ncbi:MAG: SRPBCC family protein [Sterolibacteriaceae bacterium]|uniref:SRPBCC family protein n=1 Tax=Candidatus Methylophosphatis roskildensis TaxID=2899263 RepID=A0A9D7HKD4_9PROT|nr:SRPBCC family protein [Candidatus Methylophosphatis roskildensis]
MTIEAHLPRSTRREWRIVGGVVGFIGLAGIVAGLLPAPAAPVVIRNEIRIARAAQDVFAFVTTPGNWPRWHPSSLAVSGATDHPLQVGEQVTEHFRVAGRRGRTVWTVTERTAPLHWKIVGAGQEGGHAWIAYTLTEQAGVTRFEREMRYRMPNLLAAMLDPILTRDKIAGESALAVERLKQVLEHDSGGREFGSTDVDDGSTMQSAERPIS